MVFAALIAAGRVLLRFLPAIVTFVKHVSSLIEQVGKEANNDNVISDSVRDRINHVNVMLSDMSGKMGVSYAIPAVVVPADIEGWSAVATDITREYHESRLAPMFIDNVALLWLSYGNPDAYSARSTSDLLGINDAAMRAKISADTVPARAAAAETAYNTIVEYLNSDYDILTSMRSKMEATSDGQFTDSSLVPEPINSAYVHRKNFEMLIQSCHQALILSSPYREIAPGDQIFIPVQQNWDTLNSSERQYILGMGGVKPNNGDVSLHLTKYIEMGWRLLPRGDGYSIRPQQQLNFTAAAPPAATQLDFFEATQYNECTLRGGVDIESTRPTDDGAANQVLFELRASYSLDDSPPVNVSFRNLPKSDSYQWFALFNIETRFPGFSEYVTPGAAGRKVPALAIWWRPYYSSGPYNWTFGGTFGLPPATAEISSSRATSSIFNLPIPSGPNETYSALQLCIRAFCFEPGPGANGIMTYGMSKVPVEFNIDPIGFRGILKKSTLPPSTISYRLEDGVLRYLSNGSQQFSEFLGKLMDVPGDDPNLSLQAIWRSRLGNSGVEFNQFVNALAVYAQDNSVDINTKYIEAGYANGLNELTAINNWLSVSGPFYQKDRDQISKAINYLLSDLSTFAYVLNQSPKGNNALTKYRPLSENRVMMY